MFVYRVGMEFRLWRENLKRDFKVFMKFYWIVESRVVFLVLDMIIVMYFMKGIYWGLGLKMFVLEIEGIDSLSYWDFYF